jgi:hypothetical protein
MLGETFPDIQPSLWLPRERDNQDRDEAPDGWVQINSWEPPENDGLIWFPRAEWHMLSTDERKTLRRHWRHNRRKTFAVFDFWRQQIEGLYIATGNGATARYTLPAKLVSGLVVYLDSGAGPVVAAPQPALLAGAGADAADDIQFGGNVTNGSVISFDALDARQRYYVIYSSIETEPGRRSGSLYTWAVEFLEQPRSVAA